MSTENRASREPEHGEINYHPESWEAGSNSDKIADILGRTYAQLDRENVGFKSLPPMTQRDLDKRVRQTGRGDEIPELWIAALKQISALEAPSTSKQHNGNPNLNAVSEALFKLSRYTRQHARERESIADVLGGINDGLFQFNKRAGESRNTEYRLLEHILRSYNKHKQSIKCTPDQL